MLPLFATRFAGGTPSVSLVVRLLGTHWLKRQWAPKRGRVKILCLAKNRSKNVCFFPWISEKVCLSSIFFSRTLKKGAGQVKILYCFRGWGVKTAEPTYQLHWRGARHWKCLRYLLWCEFENYWFWDYCRIFQWLMGQSRLIHKKSRISHPARPSGHTTQ